MVHGVTFNSNAWYGCTSTLSRFTSTFGATFDDPWALILEDVLVSWGYEAMIISALVEVGWNSLPMSIILLLSLKLTIVM